MHAPLVSDPRRRRLRPRSKVPRITPCPRFGRSFPLGSCNHRDGDMMFILLVFILIYLIFVTFIKDLDTLCEM